MKLGVGIKIDVSKIDKNKLYQGKNGTYLDATVFIDTGKESKWGDHGMITQSVTKDEKEEGIKGAILGNVKVFWSDTTSAPHQNTSAPHQNTSAPVPNDDIPF